jgi:hypothetical protein
MLRMLLPAMPFYGLQRKMGGEGGRGGGKEREEKKRRERLEDSYLCHSTDAQQSHVSLAHILLSDTRFP